jgi:hypothetical protein
VDELKFGHSVSAKISTSTRRVLISENKKRVVSSDLIQGR